MAYQIIQTKGSSKAGRLGEGLAKGFAGYREQQLMNEQRREEREKLERELANRRYGYELNFLQGIMPSMMGQRKFDKDQYDRKFGASVEAISKVLDENAEDYEGKVFKIVRDENGKPQRVAMTASEIRMLGPMEKAAYFGSSELKKTTRELHPQYDEKALQAYGQYMEYAIPRVKDEVNKLEAMREKDPNGFVKAAKRLRGQIADEKKTFGMDRGSNVYLGLLVDDELNSILGGYQNQLHRVNQMLEDVGMLEAVKEAERQENGGKTVIEVANEDSSVLEKGVSAAVNALGGTRTDRATFMPEQPAPDPLAPQPQPALTGQDAMQAGLGGIRMNLPQRAQQPRGQGIAGAIQRGLGGGKIPRADEITSRPYTWHEGSREKEPVTFNEKVSQGYKDMMSPVTQMKSDVKAREEKNTKEADYQKWRMDVITNFKGDQHLYDLAVKYSQEYQVPLEYVLETMNKESSAGQYNEGDTKHRKGPSVGPMHVLREGAIEAWNQAHPKVEEQYTVDQAREAEIGTMIGTWYLRQMMDKLTESQVPTDYGNTYGAYNKGFEGFMSGRR